MFVNGKEYTHCRVCKELVKTGGTINRMITFNTLNKHLKQHAKDNHAAKIDIRN